MDRVLFGENMYLVQRPVLEMVEFGGGVVVPVTGDGYCPFLSDDLSCRIYDRRPEVCRKFGDESDVRMSCVYQTRDGEARGKVEARKIENAVDGMIKGILGAK